MASVYERLSERELLEHVAEFPPHYQNVPEKFKTDEFHVKCIIANSNVFRFIAPEHRNEHLSELAIQFNTSNFKEIPDHVKTKEMCISVVGRDPVLMKYVPANLLDQEILNEAQRRNQQLNFVTIDPKFREDLKPDHNLRVESMHDAINAVIRNPRNFNVLPDEFITRDLYLEMAATGRRELLELIDDDYIDRQFIDDVYKLNPTVEVTDYQATLASYKSLVAQLEKMNAQHANDATYSRGAVVR